MKWQIFLFFILFSLLYCCKKDEPEPIPIDVYGPKAGELVFTELAALKEASSEQVRANAHGGILVDTVLYNDPRLIYGLLPDNLNLEANLTMSYIFHHDSLMRIIFRDTTTTSNFDLAQHLSVLAQESVFMDSIRHFIALEGDIAAQVIEFPSVDSLWSYINFNDIDRDEVSVLSSIWRNSGTVFSISYAGDVDLATGQFRFIDSNGITRGGSIFGKNQYSDIWDYLE